MVSANSMLTNEELDFIKKSEQLLRLSRVSSDDELHVVALDGGWMVAYNVTKGKMLSYPEQNTCVNTQCECDGCNASIALIEPEGFAIWHYEIDTSFITMVSEEIEELLFAIETRISELAGDNGK